ncbi:putative tail tape measure protein [Xanthomonas phage Elanor]|uniref:Tail tape measure protein n=1 Tax=Xanthomonas phage Elanor TaxID=2939127 RepID=A0A9E7E1K1_9CAUD|nr:putative tail tape measure protein [Xanthomonas phage Elanor]URA07007.1 putative tail tape measure protein [Xanthomonas phage Elanor]
MTDVASLAIRVESLQVQQAGTRLKGLASSGGAAERATGGLTSAFTKFLAPLSAVVTVMGTLNKLVGVQREFDVLNSGLVTATGSADKAALAFEALEEFAARTPYGLQQATEGFTKLVNLGLTPSERALESYGNTASAMGKDLMQLVEAVADATTGEFERLKEFGIKAKQQGDQVSLTFRGVTTQIGNNAAEIEKYLMDLGENEFAGAMALRADTLDGALAELGDTWDGLWRSINEMGVGDAIEESVRTAIAALEELTAMVESGQIEALLKSQTVQWASWGSDIETSIAMVTEFIKENFGEWEDEGEGVVQFLINAFTQLPSNLRAMVQILTVEFAAGIDRMVASAEFWRDSMKAIFSDDTVTASFQRYQTRIESIQAARLDSIDTALQERDATVKAADEQIKKAAELRAEYDKNKAAAAAAAKEDRLAQFKVGADGSSKASGGVDKAAESARKAREREFESLRQSLRTEEEAIKESYETRRKIIEANTTAGSDMRTTLMSRLDAERTQQLSELGEYGNSELEQIRQSMLKQEDVVRESYARRIEIIRANMAPESAARAELEAKVGEARDKALADLEKQRQAERDSLYNSLLTEQEMLLQAYERKKGLILASEEVTELERQDLLRRLKKQFDDETDKSEQERMNKQLQSGAALFGGLADLAKGYAGEQSRTYKVLFGISKAFSITQAAMSIATGLAKAQELGWPASLAAMAQVAASGASIISQIQGSNFSGAYDEGGQIPAGKIGLVGEYGPELIKGPASITGRVSTARAMQEAGGQSGGQAPAPQTNLRIINQYDTGHVADFMGSDVGEEIIMNAVRSNATTIRSLAAGG